MVGCAEFVESSEPMKSDPESLGMELTSHEVTARIVTLRGVQVMLDRDLADFYGVKPIRLREQVKWNRGRFPADFMFQLTEDESLAMVSQIAIPSWQQLGGSLPYAFTEQGVAALSAVLRSERAVEVSVRIARAFVSMRRLLQHQGPLFQRLETVELKQLEADEKFHQIFNPLEARDDKRPRQGGFYNGQIFDAYAFVASLIKQAKRSLVLVDNYVDESVLLMLSKRGPGGVGGHLHAEDRQKAGAGFAKTRGAVCGDRGATRGPLSRSLFDHRWAGALSHRRVAEGSGEELFCVFEDGWAGE